MTTERARPLDGRRWRVGLACNALVRQRYVDAADLALLERRADFAHRQFSIPSERGGPAPHDALAESELTSFASDLDVLIVCHGSPRVGAAVLDRAPGLGLLGELEGDRFGYRIDVTAAHERGVRVVDTSHGSSAPTAEWALGLALIGLRNAGALFRRILAREPTYLPAEQRSGPGYDGAELAGKRIGMIGFGHVARHLVELLRPFQTEIRAFDPFVPRELAGAYGVVFGPLEAVLDADVVFVLVPQTPSTEGMLGAPELARLRPGSVLVNVSRGTVIDTAALLARVERGDVIACLDVFDPEPMPLDTPFVDLPNVFLSPHVAGVTEESRRRFFALMVAECLRYFDGLEPLAELTPRVVELRSSGAAS